MSSTRVLHFAFVLLIALFSASLAQAQQAVSFPTSDGGTVFADLYGTVEKAVILVHGGQFNKESWAPQAKQLVVAGYECLPLTSAATASRVGRATPIRWTPRFSLTSSPPSNT